MVNPNTKYRDIVYRKSAIKYRDINCFILYELTGGEETVMKPVSVWGSLGGHDGQRPMGKFGQDAGVTP